MMTIPNAVETIIKKKPFLESALIDGIVNLSALSRQIKPKLEEMLGKEVNDGAIIMALNRLVPKLEMISILKFKSIMDNVGDIIVRSNLIDYSYVNSKTLHHCQADLLDRIKSKSDVFCTFSQGIGETTLVVSNVIAPMVEQIFDKEELVEKYTNLSSITVKLPKENSNYPGVYYYIFKKLAWDNINVVDVISTTSEFTIIVEDSNIHKAFSILMEIKNQNFTVTETSF